MDEKEDRPPTYDELLEQNAELRDRIAALQRAGEKARADRQKGPIKSKRVTRVLDPGAPSVFDRPYDGR